MPTYSLTLRQDIGRRLTIPEMDGNFQYLEELALCGGGSAVDLPEGYVAIGGGYGNSATGSQFFTFDSACKNLVVGDYNSICNSNWPNSSRRWAQQSSPEYSFNKMGSL